MIDNPETFKDALVRIATRDKIAAGLIEKKSPKQITKEVKTSTDVVNAIKVADVITTQERLVDEKTRKLVENLQKQVEIKFPEISNIALVPLGSAAHGGRMVRGVLGTQEDSDLDLGMVYDYDQEDRAKTYEISRFIDDKVSEIAKTHGFDSKYHLCEAINPGVYRYPNLKSQDSVLQIFQYPDHGMFSGEKVITYFMESIPKKVNESNQKMILRALGDIHKISPDLWKKYIDQILRSWSAYHRLKSKHLMGKNTKDLYGIGNRYEWEESASAHSKSLVQTVATESRFAMQEPLRKLLESTGM